MASFKSIAKDSIVEFRKQAHPRHTALSIRCGWINPVTDGSQGHGKWVEPKSAVFNSPSRGRTDESGSTASTTVVFSKTSSESSDAARKRSFHRETHNAFFVTHNVFIITHTSLKDTACSHVFANRFKTTHLLNILNHQSASNPLPKCDLGSVCALVTQAHECKRTHKNPSRHGCEEMWK